MILSLQTKHISPQHHIAFNNDFSTVPSIPEDVETPPWWNELDLEENSLRIPLDQDNPVLLDKDWLSGEELEERSRRDVGDKQLRQVMTQPLTNTPYIVSEIIQSRVLSPPSTESSLPSPVPQKPSPSIQTNVCSEVPPPRPSIVSTSSTTNTDNLLNL